MIEKFSEAGLDSQILNGIADLGFETPTPIQSQTLPYILKNKQDLVALAQTGTGKTAAFGLPILQLLQKDARDIQSLILCPTRELCMQITSDLEKFTKYLPQIKICAVYGGASIEPQINALKKGVHIVVGTPGRSLDLIKRKVLKVHSIKWLVLDEADEMLNMGFKEDLDAILEGTPAEKKTFLFSATMPNEISKMAENYMSDYETIKVGKQNSAAANVNHAYFMVQAKDRFEALKRIADIHPNIYGIVFCRTRRETKEVADKMMAGGYNADALHGDLSQSQRTYVMNRFRSKQLQILVATDVAARGLDVQELTHVINYNLPDDLEVYIHRSGRTGRAGNKGTSITIIHSREKNKIRQLEKLANAKFERLMVPTGDQICEKQLFNLIDKIEKVELEGSQIDKFMPTIYEKLSGMSKEDIIKHVVSVEFTRFLDYYKNARDLNIDVNESGSSSSDRRGRRDRGRNKERDFDTRSRKEKRGNRGDIRSEGQRDRSEARRHSRPSGEKGYTRFYVNLGSKKGVDTTKLIGIINESTKNKEIPIGKIDIMKKFSFFEVDSKYKNEIKKGFGNFSFDGSGVLVEESKPDVKSTGDKPRDRKRNKDRRS